MLLPRALDPAMPPRACRLDATKSSSWRLPATARSSLRRACSGTYGSPHRPLLHPPLRSRPGRSSPFLGDSSGFEWLRNSGPAAYFAHAADQPEALFGSAVSRRLRPLAASNWSRMTYVGGAYSHALPGHAAAREALARPFDQRLFFAGEATHVHDYSTAHGAYDSGLRAAEEAIAALMSAAGMNATKSGPSGSS